MVISLHEYKRVNCLRKIAIRGLSKTTDLICVSNAEMRQSIMSFCSHSVIRPIPTNIYDSEALDEPIQRDKSTYVYFGLINKAKAFDEMLEGWDDFNADMTKKLYVITGSEIPSDYTQHRNVEFIHNARDAEIIRTMRRCVYCIVPVKPNVDMKNTTFKTGCVAGCICVACFSKEYEALPFVIPMQGYGVRDFIEVFEHCAENNAESETKMGKEAAEFGKQYLPKRAAAIVADELYNLAFGEQKHDRWN